MVDWYVKVLKDYAVFSGRARRAEYWYFALVHVIISCVLGAIGYVVASLSFIASLYALAILIPSIAAAIRRFHDTGRSGWFLLLAFVPVIGTIVVIIFLAQDSQPEENQYGPNPKAPPA